MSPHKQAGATHPIRPEIGQGEKKKGGATIQSPNVRPRFCGRLSGKRFPMDSLDNARPSPRNMASSIRCLSPRLWTQSGRIRGGRQGGTFPIWTG